jgi:hypothetical protein
MKNFVARTTSSRRPLSALPTIPSDSPAEHDERSGDEEQVGVVGQRAHVQARAENDEEEGDEEAFCDPADLSRQSLRSADCGHDEPHGESGEEHARTALPRDPCQTKEHDK